MSVVYSLYDALVSIKVPDEKAKAVVDALEREMMDKIATRADVANLRLSTQADLTHVREILSRDIQNLANTMTIKLGTISGIWMGILFALLKLTA